MSPCRGADPTVIAIVKLNIASPSPGMFSSLVSKVPLTFVSPTGSPTGFTRRRRIPGVAIIDCGKDPTTETEELVGN